MIIDRLEEKGPATQKQLIDELGIPKNTMNNNIRNILFKKLGIVLKLDNDKYGLKWHIPEEDEVKFHYHKMSRKLKRNPTPEEMAGLIKKDPSDARRLLFKYIPLYREPDRNEISSAASEVWDMIVWGGLYGKFKTKKNWFEMRVSKVVVTGIDESTFDKIMNSEPPVQLAEAGRYLEDFPEMGPTITSKKDGARMLYKTEWDDDVKNVLRPLLHSYHFWRKRFEVQLPRRLDEKLYRRYREFLNRNEDYALARITEMAEKCAPSQDALDDLLKWMGSPKNGHQALMALRYFCKNGLEVGQLDDETQKKIANSLLDAFFSGKPSDDQRYEPAMEIIAMLDVREDGVVSKSKEIILSSLRKGSDENRIQELKQWLAQDPKLRGELIEGAEAVMMDSEDDRVARLCKSFIKSI